MFLECFRLVNVCVSNLWRRLYYTNKQSLPVILGIETSCDDTGAAVVDADGNILGEALHSQLQIHLEHGGIIPPVARDLHHKHIQGIVNMALERSQYELKDLSAIATTVKPGLPLSLVVGLKYSKQLVKETAKPFIPIHHMEAHALTARMAQNVEFPFLVLLVSGGHCQLAIVRNIDNFLLLGSTLDDAPGEAFDKIARRLKLRNIPAFSTVGGGQAIETLAKEGNSHAFNFPTPLSKYRDCNFSFSGLKFRAYKIITEEEKKHDIIADLVLPNVADICASFQHAVANHIVKRVHRALLFCELKELLPMNNKVLVVSGGVACNNYIRAALKLLCDHMDFELVCPPPKLCTDNGIMIAWNGIERYRAGIGIAENLDEVDIQAKCPLGKDISTSVEELSIKFRNIKIRIPQN
ncbi:threonyl-carbamoyl synthesis 4 isoform X2 [Tachypleus tridentatus]|uniref:threonyl-carbamoyl synthesis 4 isoform X2 n=1 Tax=Tachypleus tridentatus TaxID=6853 RepID=UPI003FD1B48B